MALMGKKINVQNGSGPIKEVNLYSILDEVTDVYMNCQYEGINCYASVSNDPDEVSEYGTDLIYSRSEGSYNVLVDKPSTIEYSLYKWAPLTYSSEYMSMTTQDFIESGIPNIEVLQNCNNAANCFDCCFQITESPFIITSNKCQNMSGAFRSCSSLINAPVIPNGVINMEYMFYQCTSLSIAPNIPNSVTTIRRSFSFCNISLPPTIPNSIVNMEGTFMSCDNLISAPIIPNSVTNMCITFGSCFNLTSAPVIPNSVLDMSETFSTCPNLITTPVIPNSVINLCNTFYNCQNLKYISYIGNSVINMRETFEFCHNLEGNINIYSDNVNDCYSCFYGVYANKEKYIYCNKDTQTWNTFYNYLGGIDNSTLNAHLRSF